MAPHSPLAGVVRRERRDQVELKEQVAEIPGTADDILDRVEPGGDSVTVGGPGHQLHEADRPSRRRHVRTVTGLGLNHGVEQPRINAVTRRSGIDEAEKRLAPAGSITRLAACNRSNRQQNNNNQSQQARPIQRPE